MKRHGHQNVYSIVYHARTGEGAILLTSRLDGIALRMKPHGSGVTTLYLTEKADITTYGYLTRRSW